MLIVFCLVGGGILIASLWRTAQSQVAQKLGITEPSPAVTVQLSSWSQVPLHGSYQLPDPGILPTNPFYSVKMMYDRLRLISTRQPQEQARLLLAYSNTRMAAASQMLKKGNHVIAVSLATKGSLYLDQALRMLDEEIEEKDGGFVAEVELAMLKHEEIVEQIQAVTTGGSHQQAGILYERLTMYRQRIEGVTHRPFSLARPEDNQ